jgi:hypothetical protein
MTAQPAKALLAQGLPNCFNTKEMRLSGQCDHNRIDKEFFASRFLFLVPRDPKELRPKTNVRRRQS